MIEQAPTTARALLGRRRELADARAVVDAGLAGAGALLLVTGEAGIGKSRLVDELAGETARAGARVVWGVCWDDPGTPPFWPWARIVRDVAEALGIDPPADLAPLLGAGAESDGPAEQLRLRLYESTLAFFRRAARRQPLVVVIEDLHLSDLPSLHLLRYLATGLRGDPAVAVATSREAAAGTEPRAAALAEVASAGPTLPLLGLNPEAVAELVETVTGEAPQGHEVAILHEHTGGNPLFVLETAKLLAARGRPNHTDMPIPPSVRQVIEQRLAYLSSDAVAAIGIASVVGQTFSAALVERVAGQAASRVADLLDEAVNAGVVRPAPELGRFEFTHAVLREVAYRAIPARLRRARHRLVAEAIEALHGTGDDVRGLLADHHVWALPDSDPALALDHMRSAAEHALAMLGYEDAARRFGRAVELAEMAQTDEGDRVELLLALGDARLRAGDWPGATQAYEEVAAAARRRGRQDELARAALGLGAGLSGFEVRLFDHRQIDLLREALDHLDEADSDLRAWVLSRLSVAESFVVDTEVRVRRSRDAVATARRSADPRLLVHALSSYCDAIAGPDHTDERLAIATEMVETAQRVGLTESELLGRRYRIVAQLEAGDIAAVDADIETFERGAARLRWPLVEWYPPLWRGTRAILEGRLADAERLEEEARRIGRRAGSTNAEILTDVLRLARLMEQGRPDEARRLLDRFLDDPEGGPNAEAWLALPFARMGRTGEARALLDRLAATGFNLVRDGAWLEVIASVAEACAEVGHADAARKLLPLLEPYADRFATGGMGAICLGSMSRFVARLAHCAGRLDDADRYFQRAHLAHRRAGAVLFIAHTQRQHAELLRVRDRPADRTEAEAKLAEADEIYRDLGLAHLHAQPSAAVRPTPGNLFRRDGDTWTVRYGGHEATVRHVKGLTVLARLLAEPEREFHVADLANDGDDRAATLIRSADTGEIIDAQARRAYKRRLEELEAEIDEAEANADLHRADRAVAERDALIDQLSSAVGLAGRPRHDNAPSERARWTVTKQVRTAVARIEQVHPDLARHLTTAVRTGRFCSYSPERPIGWEQRDAVVGP